MSVVQQSATHSESTKAL